MSTARDTRYRFGTSTFPLDGRAGAGALWARARGLGPIRNRTPAARQRGEAERFPRIRTSPAASSPFPLREGGQGVRSQNACLLLTSRRAGYLRIRGSNQVQNGVGNANRKGRQ